METNEYHNHIVDYYRETGNAYKDSWDLDNSLSIHYGYWDETVKSFPASLLRMNEVMMESAAIKVYSRVLDAGCGVGGSSIFLAEKLGCKVPGITLSELQVQKATIHARQKKLDNLVEFKVMNYCSTDFPAESFDIVWGCESICYAENKEQFIKEAWRLLRPGGRLVVADGFVSTYDYNDDPTIRQWLDGWQVNYLESPKRFEQFMIGTGFTAVQYRNISKEVAHSSQRLYRFYFLASLYLWWKKLTSSRKATEMHEKNIKACRYQYRGMKKGLWEYGILTGTKS